MAQDMFKFTLLVAGYEVFKISHSLFADACGNDKFSDWQVRSFEELDCFFFDSRHLVGNCCASFALLITGCIDSGISNSTKKAEMEVLGFGQIGRWKWKWVLELAVVS